MSPRSYTSEGIVLTRIIYGEADRIISVYTKDYGRISLLAKGVRRPKSRKRGHLENFSYINFHAVRGRGLDILTEVEIIEEFCKLKKSLKKISLAYYFCEVVGKTTREGEKNLDLFNLLLSYLKKLKNENQLKILRLNFISRLLIILGYWPEGKEIDDPDRRLEEVTERKISSMRVGIKMIE